MRTTTLLFTALFISMALSLNAQTYSTGFDTPAARSAWTEYRLNGTASTDWSFSTFYSVSPTYSLTHDYPMSGDNVQDWFVSPRLLFTGNSGHVSLYSRISAMSSPPDIYYGVWISFGSKDPHSGDYIQLANLTLFPSVQGTWVDTTISPAYTGDTGYIAIKYQANNYMWLMVWIDDINVDSATLVPVSGIEKNIGTENPLVYPNPSDGIFNISNINICDVEVSDISGRVIYQSAYESKNAIIDLRGKPKGLYFIRITDKQGSEVRKIVLI